MKCDVTKEADVSHLASSAESYCKKNKCKVWAIVNNAGIADGGALDWTGSVFREIYHKGMEIYNSL